MDGLMSVEECYRGLAMAICEKAVSDLAAAYSACVRSDANGSHRPARADLVIADCESFFRSEWFMVLCEMDGGAMIRGIRSRCGYFG
jgi:hypothetical protein